MTPAPETLAQVIGRNARTLRLAGGHTQQGVATAMVRLGLPWDSGRVARLEAGDSVPTLPTVVLVAAALDQLTSARVAITVVDLLRSDAMVALAPGITVPSSALIGVMRGGGAAALVPEPDYPFVRTGESPTLDALRATYGRTEQRAAATLGVDRAMMLSLSAELWGRNLGEERDVRAQEAGITSRVEKARITQALAGELEALWEQWATEEPTQ